MMVARMQRAAFARHGLPLTGLLSLLILPPLGLVAITFGSAAVARACPFCGTVGDSLARRRDAAAVVAVGEAEGTALPDGEGGTWQRFRLDQVLRADGAAAAGGTVRGRVAGPVTGTALLFGVAAPPAKGELTPSPGKGELNPSFGKGELNPSPGKGELNPSPGKGELTPSPGKGELNWSAVAADETLLGYAASAPAVSVPAAVRLRWFAARLEHPDPAIAADAFTEFGLAPFASVRAAADAVDLPRLCTWLTEPGIDARRRGLYGLLLGVAAAATDDHDRRRTAIAQLQRAVASPADDFRAGFDGVLAGVLVAEGTAGLEFFRARGLFGPTARPLDQRHLLAALRFAGESLADTIPRERIIAATAALLTSPAVAADATIDLARYQAWAALDDVADVWDALGADDPLIRRAVAGYLTACPLPAARRRLEALRKRQPILVQQAIDAAGLPAGR